MNDFDGLPKSTYYYRKKHTKKETFASIARLCGVTRQSVYIFARRNGIEDMQMLKEAYLAHWQEAKAKRKARYSPSYGEFEIISSEPCEKGHIRQERQTGRDRRRNIIRIVQEA
jgi:DNA-binding MurR/RpiR family transcriptional regulator